MNPTNAAKGYIAFKKETTKGTPVTPTVYAPYYEQSMSTVLNMIEDEPIVGSLFSRFQVLQGIREHTGSVTFMCEPNTLGYLVDMTAAKTATSGSNPYTHTFKDSLTADPNSYTMDISFGSHVVRFYGVECSDFKISADGDLFKVTANFSALGSFYGREISSVSTTTVNLTTTYDESPTTGLVASDLIHIQTLTASTTLNTTVASITDADTFVAGASAASYAQGDIVRLRPATPSYSLLTPFTWPKMRAFFSDTAANAMTASSTTSNQTRLERGFEFSLMNPFENAGGESRSGSFDPAALLRTTYDVSCKIKLPATTAEQIRNWETMVKRAVVFRFYAGSTNQYELRLTLNNFKPRTVDSPSESKKSIYNEIDLAPVLDSSDGQGFDIKVINAVATI